MSRAPKAVPGSFSFAGRVLTGVGPRENGCGGASPLPRGERARVRVELRSETPGSPTLTLPRGCAARAPPSPLKGEGMTACPWQSP